MSLDRRGLPPTPEDAEAFARDSSPDVSEKLVERLLTSPHYRERWVRKRLDLARYADTNGDEKDRPRVIWPSRDRVIGALNADEPGYDIKPLDLAKRQNEILSRIATVKSRLPERLHLDEEGFNPAKRSELLISEGRKPEVQPDKSWLIAAKGTETETYTATLETLLESIDAVRLLEIPERKLPNSGTGRAAEAGRRDCRGPENNPRENFGGRLGLGQRRTNQGGY